MAEAVLRDIVEQIVQETDAASSPKDISVGNDVALKYVESNENKTVGSENEETKEVIRKEKTDLDDVDYIHTETDKEVESESDPSDDASTDDNNNDFLTTEDEAEDFLKHVLRDNNDSDQDDGKAKTGFELSSDGCGCIGETLTESEERLNIAAALINFGDIQNDQAKPIHTLEQTSEKVLSVDLNKCLKQPVDQESPYFSNTTDIDIDNVNKNDVPIVDTCSLLGIDMTVGDTKSSSNCNQNINSLRYITI
ncbi:uncharacterized protein LOC132733847 [Ruditapes philippinarum]|uniref:uncharacterized protein LOC132733847 n=1 Tax=Ruditapes philippinarum TaxID=129788 RepID=UPI00295BF0EE|nr:uncharacterized protein LOC132733847 [Ruditapes philippinarum]